MPKPIARIYIESYRKLGTVRVVKTPKRPGGPQLFTVYHTPNLHA